ncbi:hypothetical protein BaRGS_00034066 [Batillaria attramentaria]|uniref:Uncharacterized protein n=1 Tax=Batillaria attramentaria TaxID=370345 RepID=A0ABD0JIE8_9CAEN
MWCQLGCCNFWHAESGIDVNRLIANAPLWKSEVIIEVPPPCGVFDLSASEAPEATSFGNYPHVLIPDETVGRPVSRLWACRNGRGCSV